MKPDCIGMQVHLIGDACDRAGLWRRAQQLQNMLAAIQLTRFLGSRRGI
jgi:hypothetical protein